MFPAVTLHVMFLLYINTHHSLYKLVRTFIANYFTTVNAAFLTKLNELYQKIRKRLYQNTIDGNFTSTFTPFHFRMLLAQALRFAWKISNDMTHVMIQSLSTTSQQDVSMT